MAHIEELTKQIQRLEKELLAWHKTNDASRRLATIPGVGLITATALAATVTDPSHFKSGRQFAAWLGLTPRQNSSGGKNRLGSISKMGDRYLRTLLIIGATWRHSLCALQRVGQRGVDQWFAGKKASPARLSGTR